MNAVETYDVAIIGCGIAGIYAGFELLRLHPSLRVVMLEQGTDIRHRSCPMITRKTAECVGCQSCAIMRGFGGAGAFSDGKYNFTTAFGGWLREYLPDEEIMALIDYVDAVNMRFGATDEVYSTDSDAARALGKRALENDLHLLDAKVKHLGTENNLRILTNIFEFMADKVTFHFNTTVDSINKTTDGYRLKTSDGDIASKYLIAAPGRSGAEWFAAECTKLGLELINNQVDIGVRVELPAAVFEHITSAVYESKLHYRTKQYGDLVRTFCMNPYGHVVAENVDGLITVNGHSYADPALQSPNTNFALLVSNRFTEPFKEPYKYGKHIASLSNMLGGGVIIQRFGDLLKGIRTNEQRLSKSFVQPTLQATPGDLGLVLPKRHMDNIVEMLFALDKIAPGTANYDTLLYGVEVKFYSSRPQLTPSLETSYDGFYAIGDGAGVTRGLAQAAASGVIAARSIVDKLSPA